MYVYVYICALFFLFLFEGWGWEERDSKKESSCLWAYSLSAHSWAGPKPGAQGKAQVCQELGKNSNHLKTSAVAGSWEPGLRVWPRDSHVRGGTSTGWVKCPPPVLFQKFFCRNTGRRLSTRPSRVCVCWHLPSCVMVSQRATAMPMLAVSAVFFLR